MGGTYNEPNTNLTSPETTIRNFVHGIGFQRDVLGGDPETAWQLDVFGHDPQFPGHGRRRRADLEFVGPRAAPPVGADAQRGRRVGACSSAASSNGSRRPAAACSPTTCPRIIRPAGGWTSRPRWPRPSRPPIELFAELKKVALTRNVLLPVGTDYTPPNKWVTEIHRDWASRYTWPRFVCALPREFFAAVRAELDDRDEAPSPQTRDMNPIYTGKDVSFIDTKQANRAAEDAVLDAEKFAVFAGLLAGADYPQAALAKAWVQLAYGAHHDAITGSESDQVYLDLLTGWRDAWELGRAARDNSLALLSSAVDGEVVVWNTLAHNRTDIVTARFADAARRARAGAGSRRRPRCPRWSSTAARSVSWLARDVPSLGWRAYRLAAGDADSRLGVVGGQRNRQRALPVGRRPRARRRCDVAGARRQTADRRRPSRQRAGRLRRVPGASDRRRRPVAPAAQGAGGRLVGNGGAGAGLPQPAGPAAGRPRSYRRPTALHPDADAVARRRPGRLRHHHRRLRRRRPTAAAALAVPGAGRDAGQRSRRRGGRSRFCVAAQSYYGLPVRRYRRASVDAGQPGLRLVRAVVGGAGARRRRRACGVGGRGGRADRGGGRPAGARPDGRAGAGRRHGDLQQRRPAALRAPRRRLQPARHPDHAAARTCLPRRCWPPRIRRTATRSSGSLPRPAGPPSGCPPPRRWRKAGFPMPTCGTRGRCRCW